MAPGDRSEDTPIARQFLLGQRCPDPPQRGRELVQGHRVPMVSFPPGQSSSANRPRTWPVSMHRLGRKRRRSIKAVPPCSWRRCSTVPLARRKTAPISRKLPLLSWK
jgi:hypothetical protein